MFRESQKKIKSGFSLVDVLVGTSIILIIFIGVFGAFQLGFKVVGLSQNKIVAVAIANEKIEMARNLSYESVGTLGAELPFADGVLDSEETIIRNNIEYIVQTEVKYIIDAADGIAGEDDACPNDYKRIKVKVLWGGVFEGAVSLITDMSPENLSQECAEIGGVLWILVFDAYGKMVPFPLIEVLDPDTGATVDTASPVSGEYYFPLSQGTYSVHISKDGHNTERTYGEGEIAFPTKPHPIVVSSETMSFSIDELSGLSVNTFSLIDEEPVPVPNVPFLLEGEKIIGKDENGDPVLEYSENLATDGQGFLGISNLEWDNYTFSVPLNTGLSLSYIDSSPQPVGLLPGSLLVVDLFLTAENSFLATVKDQETLEPIFFATIKLSNVSLQYDEIQYTNQDGQTLFMPLEEGSYDLEVSADDFSGTTTTIYISGDTSIEIQLERFE